MSFKVIIVNNSYFIQSTFTHLSIYMLLFKYLVWINVTLFCSHFKISGNFIILVSSFK